MRQLPAFLLLSATRACLCASLIVLSACGGGGGTAGSVAEAPDENPSPDTVATDCGTFRGSINAATVAFKGMPYASPPTGNLRFRPPAAPACSAEIQIARQFAPACPQLTLTGDSIGQEDCLYLNVWTPATEFPAQPTRPVIVYIHGGGNTTGATDIERFGATLLDGERAAANGNAVIVTMAYRLGALGFLAHPALSAEDPNNVSGNYGIYDQIAALEWVQRNIERFGGDPDRVALIGQSAGAQNVCAIVASARSQDLFQAAAIHSGACNAPSLAASQADGEDIAELAGCAAGAAASCLRGLTTDAWLQAIGTSLPLGTGFVQQPVGPIADGFLLADSPLAVIASGAHNQVPLIVGATTNESAAFSIPAITTETYEALVLATFTIIAPQVLAAYPASAYPSPRDALIALTSDSQFVCPARRTARAAAASQAQPVFLYSFNKALESPQYESLGAFHGLELFYLFQQLEQINSYAPTVADLNLASSILNYWTALADSGNPNGSAEPLWPAYNEQSEAHLNLAAPISAGSDLSKSQCDFWDGFALGFSI